MEDKINISYLLNESWNILKKHFWLLISILFLFNFIPMMIYNIYTINQPFDETLLINQTTGTINWSILGTYLISEVLIIIILTIISTFGVVAIISLLLGKTKTNNIGELLNQGSKYYIKVLLVMILLTLMLIPLYILLIIPGLIFSVYWMFSQYFIIDENEKVTKTFGRSIKIVKDNWWSVVGRLLLVGLIAAAILIGFSLFLGIILILIYGLSALTVGIPAQAEIITNVITLLVQLPITLFILIYTVQLYKGLKEKYEQKNKNPEKTKIENKKNKK